MACDEREWVSHLIFNGFPGDAVVAAVGRNLCVSDADDVTSAARALATGCFVVHSFGNIYGLSTRGDAPTVRAANAFKGRPAGQIGSVTTTQARLVDLFDFTRLHGALRPDDILGVIDDLLCLGPFGFRAPAADHLPDHLTVQNGRGRWVQVIVPGYRCPGNVFLAQCLELCGTDHLHITSANRSRHATGATEEPAHYRAAPLKADFGGDPRLLVLEHADEDAVLRAYPKHAPMSTSVLAFQPRQDSSGRAVSLERHGSLPVDEVRSVVAHYGIELAVPAGQRRLPQRVY